MKIIILAALISTPFLSFAAAEDCASNIVKGDETSNAGLEGLETYWKEDSVCKNKVKLKVVLQEAAENYESAAKYYADAQSMCKGEDLNKAKDEAFRVTMSLDLVDDAIKEFQKIVKHNCP